MVIQNIRLLPGCRQDEISILDQPSVVKRCSCGPVRTKGDSHAPRGAPTSVFLLPRSEYRRKPFIYNDSNWSELTSVKVTPPPYPLAALPRTRSCPGGMHLPKHIRTPVMALPDGRRHLVPAAILLQEALSLRNADVTPGSLPPGAPS